MAEDKDKDTNKVAPPAAPPAAAPAAAPSLAPLSETAEERAFRVGREHMLAVAEVQASAERRGAAGETVITDFSGAIGGPFAVYGFNLDKGGQVQINGMIPTVHVIRPTVIKGRLEAPAMSLAPGRVTVTLGSATFSGVV